ncbi:GMP/IMP nucleotidase [Pseudomonas sp. ABC1]|uniref:GMP/IMP nucleotidase n=1 Tax=Pseudomonas sp. ABC1 TaxID=2748080 RepID=UPI0015C40671|nr:GMP/IMP nucleotidase [Pseudomonas sp. ABC1]QLF93989.1 GMP/IMP nucleotidase [Pseudomonas sp. ABC1]
MTLPWNDIDTVLLDMDGTLLDLHFDNHFWLEMLPARYAERRGLSLARSKALLAPVFAAQHGHLNWYCTDYWSRELDLPIREMKREAAALIAPRPGALAFLQALREAGKRAVLITNAHRDSLAIKLERVALAPWLERLVSSHDYGFPKEDARFWQSLRQEVEFDPTRSLFIDDSLPILRSARDFGVGHLLGVRRPDSQGVDKDTEEFAALEAYQALIDQLTGARV